MLPGGSRFGSYEILPPLGAGGMGRLRGRPAPEKSGQPRLHREPSRLDAHAHMYLMMLTSAQAGFALEYVV